MNIFKTHKHLGAVIAALCFAGCMDIRAVDEQEDDVTPATKVQSHILMEARAEALDDFGKYQVVFKAKGLRGPATLQRTEIDPPPKPTDSSQMVNLVQSGDEWIDPTAVHGKTYHYKVATSLESVEVQVPLDLEIEGEVHPRSKSGKILFADPEARPRLGRLRFAEGAILTTEGRDLELVVDSIHADDSVIRSFPREQKDFELKADAPRDGGRIWIEAKKASGFLSFELRGRDGLSGGPGSEPTAEMTGAQGAAGALAVLMRVQSKCAPGAMFCIPGRTCKVHPQDGAPGNPGQKGEPGEDGQNGGDATELRLKILDDVEFRKMVYVEPGRGGDGGLGGDGGIGGPGGPAGLIVPKTELAWGVKDCNPAKDGPQGPRGEKGDSGLRGFDGKNRGAWEWKNGRFQSL